MPKYTYKITGLPKLIEAELGVFNKVMKNKTGFDDVIDLKVTIYEGEFTSLAPMTLQTQAKFKRLILEKYSPMLEKDFTNLEVEVYE